MLLTVCVLAMKLTAIRFCSGRFTVKIYKEQTNRSGNLHGGLICTLVDSVGSMALSSLGMWSSGVSTDIHTT